jgi:Flp pilus assembly pilin Flp
MNVIVQRFWHDDRGAEVMEYAVVALLILSASVPLLLLLKDQILDYVQTIFAEMQTKPPVDF